VQVDLSTSEMIDESRVEFFLENPQLLPVGFSVGEDVEIIKGGEGGATVQAVLDVSNDILWDQFTPGATLALKLRTRDSGGAEAVYDIGQVGLYGPKTVMPDLIPPDSLTDVVINGGDPVVIPAELAEDEFEFPGTAHATDIGKGIQTIQLYYQSPIGDFLSFESNMFGLTEGSHNDGLFAGTGTVGRYVEAGSYDLLFAVAEDKYGNEFSFDPEMVPASVQKTVLVVNPFADTEPPTLTSPVTIDPETADVTDDTAEVVLSFSVKDEGSGFSFGIITAFHKTDAEADTQLAFFSPEPPFLVNGDSAMGDYEVPVTIIPGATAGDYNYQIQLYDNAIRNRIYGPVRPESTFTPEPLPDGSEETFAVINNAVPDTTPPVLDSISIDCDHDFAEGPGSLKVTMMITEEESQLAFGGFFGQSSYIRVISPTGATDVTRTFSTFNQDFLNPGTYNIEIQLPQAIEPGPYCILVKLENTSGYRNFYGANYDYMPFPGEFPGTCDIINSGVTDFAAPVPVEFSVSPAFILPGEDVTLNVTMRVTDGLTNTGGIGFKMGSIALQNGVSAADVARPVIGDAIDFMAPEDGGPGTGTRYDAVYTFQFPLTGADVMGDFLSFQISLSDSVGNSRVFDSSICNTDGGRFPLPYDEAQIGSDQGNRPPAITSNGAGATAQISLEENIIDVTTVTATDPDLPGDILTFSISGGADSTLFSLDMNSGVLTFVTAPVFDPPGDANGDNVYEITVKVEDSEGEMDSQDISVTVTPDVIDENDYDAYANGENSPFPSSATAQQKAFGFDYDGDGKTNGEEFAAGTDPANAEDSFWAIVSYEAGVGTMVTFGPYTPDTNQYNLYNVFEGPENDQRMDTGLAAQVVEGNANQGYFMVPMGTVPESLLLAVGTLKIAL
ncbi:MAG: cadherin repeat domain-containing protein, partial [Verrucomicrobiae bacterium]|nr:cadherin repeat domain-containing protein [Verrucomicrobiae bacterium]